jgi:hypothetical protein
MLCRPAHHWHTVVLAIRAVSQIFRAGLACLWLTSPKESHPEHANHYISRTGWENDQAIPNSSKLILPLSNMKVALQKDSTTFSTVYVFLLILLGSWAKSV